ncbi:MAG TPA: RNA methyltransferase [Bryobacteraceae bacterium]|nr:RNA methyltransferase [Bryobacteraceae bacterium]HPQ13662.1 RNA methyltransferase [Bryobacteraceae bacterium]HPU71327.1 RNA methyltransferase [Bryobacteraceae bacterium]
MARTEILTSRANPLLKDVRRAVARGDLTHDGYCVAEGFHLLEEALRSECEVKAVLAAAPVRAAVESQVRGRDLRVVVLEDGLFQTVSATETTQGVLTLVRPPAWRLDQLFRDPTLVVVLDGVQDPGNAGAIVRAAEAFGASGAMFLKGTVNPYNPKTVRASAGSLFRLPLVSGLDETTALAALQQRRLDIYAAMPRGKRDLQECDLTRPCAFIIGNEGRGIGERLRSAALDLRIPVTGVESLNAAMAAGILLYEARRQRTPGSAVM